MESSLTQEETDALLGVNEKKKTDQNPFDGKDSEKMVKAALGADVFKREDRGGIKEETGVISGRKFIKEIKDKKAKIMDQKIGKLEPRDLGAAAAKKERKKKNPKAGEPFEFHEEKSSSPLEREEIDELVSKAKDIPEEKNENVPNYDISGLEAEKGSSNVPIPLGKSSLERGISKEQAFENTIVHISFLADDIKLRIDKDAKAGELKKRYIISAKDIKWEIFNDEEKSKIEEKLKEERKGVSAYLRLKNKADQRNFSKEDFYKKYGPEGKNIYGKELYSKNPKEGWIMLKGFDEGTGKPVVDFSGKEGKIELDNFEKLLEKYSFGKKMKADKKESDIFVGKEKEKDIPTQKDFDENENLPGEISFGKKKGSYNYDSTPEDAKEADFKEKNLKKIKESKDPEKEKQVQEFEKEGILFMEEMEEKIDWKSSGFSEKRKKEALAVIVGNYLDGLIKGDPESFGKIDEKNIEKFLEKIKK